MPGWLNRYARIALMLALVLPAFHQPAKGQAPGHVVINWTSPTYGFSISYRRDSFTYVSAASTDSGDILNLRSTAGSATVEAFPAGQPVDSCAAVALEKLSFAAERFTVLEPVQDGWGSIVTEDAEGNETTHRVDCIRSDDETWLVRFVHSAATDQFGRYASAARAIRESYRAEQPDGLIEPTLSRIEPSIPPPADSNLVNHPTRFFALELAFKRLTPGGAPIDLGRLFIPGIGPALETVWLSPDPAAATPVSNAGTSVIGRFIFAVPHGRPTITLCYQHLTDNDCTWLFDYDFTADPSSAVTEPALPVRIDPLR
jgi:hypothetical protein